ncbi:MAG TPA: 4-(cytidine 5'-diphospho)-2-C-methyl-D-erythritol kinase [Acidimicrobiia bacterium]
MSEPIRWQAPAKVNLTLEVRSRDSTGLHPLRSVMQAIDWIDVLDVDQSEEDELAVSGADLPLGGDNLVWRAIEELRKEIGRQRPPLSIALTKEIPVAAGLGGGSSDAAAALMAAAHAMRVHLGVVRDVAPRVGADVNFFLHGGCLLAEGYGERLSPTNLDADFAMAIAVPEFELETAAVYEAWDRLDGPAGRALSGKRLPPALRSLGEVRNDLTPAALEFRPELGDWMEDLAMRWERPVLMTGSGPACFSFFADLDEAQGAIKAAPPSSRAARAVVPRSSGVARDP